MAARRRDIIVVGTSAGGLEAVSELVASIPADLSAALFVVQHLAPSQTGSALLHRLERYRTMRPRLARDGETFEHGSVYIAPPDYHMLIKGTKILVTKGARENGHRPAIDPLFRSAAASHGNRVIGIVLTGHLDDGTAGLIAIQRCGGVTIVQDPAEAKYPSMPENALGNSDVDHCLPLARIGPLLGTLTRKTIGAKHRIPADVQAEAEIAERVVSDVAEVDRLGDQVPYNCPDCGGVLWEVKKSASMRYRCHVGHSFTAMTLMSIQTAKIEETLWITLRMFEERKNLLNNMIRNSPRGPTMTSTLERAREAEVHIERIRAILLAKTTSKPGGIKPAGRAKRRKRA